MYAYMAMKTDFFVRHGLKNYDAVSVKFLDRKSPL